jgi:3-methyladenine DNA glycosylase AlkD
MKAKEVLDNMLKQYQKSLFELNIQGMIRKPSIGISYPKLKLIADQIQKDNPIEFLESNDFSVYELEILQTYVIGRIKDIDVAIKHFEAFSPYAKEWSVVDSLCQRFIITKKHSSTVFHLLKQYALINDEYMQRIVAVMILSHFLIDDYIDEAIQLLGQLNHEGYYCKMAVAWAFATIMAKYPQKCIELFKQDRLDTWTHNKAIQKTIESYRVTEEHKKIVRQLKR